MYSSVFKELMLGCKCTVATPHTTRSRVAGRSDKMHRSGFEHRCFCKILLGSVVPNTSRLGFNCKSCDPVLFRSSVRFLRGFRFLKPREDFCLHRLGINCTICDAFDRNSVYFEMNLIANNGCWYFCTVDILRLII